ncbi:MAG: hypothetical protein GKR96_00770 [Gammaproteobacteria bacterium]|nr:hypothetical protein [Gammaproteobacteria bacterium]
MTNSRLKYDHTSTVLIQMLAVFLVLLVVVVWQREIVYEIYVHNQVNAVGGIVNGGIIILFFSGLFELVKRFFAYRNEELSILQFLENIGKGGEPLNGVSETHMIAKRFEVLKSLDRKKASINQSALAATLLASEASRNSFLKFVHNVLILTGVFGTIISLSMSLMGASDLIQAGYGSAAGTQGGGLSTIIYGMSTALSTTMTAIVTYLFFGYFYIKLTDTQTYLLSRIEEISATTLLPHIQINQEASAAQDYSEGMRRSSELVRKLDQSQKIYAESAQVLQAAAEHLTAKLNMVGIQDTSKSDQALMEAIQEIIELQQKNNEYNTETMSDIVEILQRGFRLRTP